MTRANANCAEIRDISEIAPRYRGCPLQEAAADKKLLAELIAGLGDIAGRKALKIMQGMRK